MLGLAAFAIVVAGVAAISAYEAHVINVTARIENALTVNPDHIDFGTVFPQEKLEENLLIKLSQSFLEEDRVDDVEYVIKQKPKVRPSTQNATGDPYAMIDPGQGPVVAHEYCLDNEPQDPGDPEDPYYEHCYPNLCGQLSKHPDGIPEAGNDTGVAAPHDWTPQGPNATGRLAKSEQDVEDNWVIDLVVPGFRGMVDQIYTEAEYGPLLDPRLEHEQFGCDLWIEVDRISESDRPTPEPRHISLENKDGNWSILPDDLIHGDIGYNHNDTSFKGLVTGTGLVADAPYQITLNGPGGCTDTDHGLAGAGANAFESGYWNSGPNLDPTCSAPGEGVYNMDLVSNWYTVITDGSGDFSHPFDLALPAGDYAGVKVLVKKMLDPFVDPWADFSSPYPAFNLYETAAISFTILP